MSTAAKFSNNVEISGNIDISGNINLDGTLTVDGSFSLYGYHIPDPTGENNKVLTISGDGYSWETVQSGGSDGDEVINSAGQTFYEIITEQPRGFAAETMTSGALFDNTISSIDIAWNFDDLIPFDANNQHLNITGDLNQRVLPCITDIYFEISSNEASNTIIATKSISVTSSHNYNTDSYDSTGSFSKNSTSMSYTLTYKTLNLSITGQDTNSYTVSIYGQNSSNGSDINKLTYTGLIFQATGIPEVPTITSITDSISSNVISFTINATTTDMDVDTDDTVLSSALYISQLDLSHTLIDSLRSVTYGLPTHSASNISASRTVAQNTGGNSTDSNGNEPVSISPTYSSANGNFYLGSKYTMQARIYNLLNADPTDYSDSVETDYSDIPTSSNKNTNNPFNGAPSLQKHSSKALLDYATDNVYNLSNLDSDARIYPSTTGTRYVQISDPNSTISDTSGYGKYIDSSDSLISINCLLYFNGTDVSLQQVDFHGWEDTYTSNVSNSNIVPFQSLNVSDMYSSSNQQKGFRRWAQFNTSDVLDIHDLSAQGFIQPFIPYNVSSGYKVQYNLTRTDGYSGADDYDTRTSSDFYVDNFPNYNQLSLDDWTGSVTVTDVEWVMGMPNVSKITIDLSSNHYNMNSEYLYFRSDGYIAQMLHLWMLQGTNREKSEVDLDTYGNALYLTIGSSSDINSSGIYYGTYSKSLDYTANTSSSFSNNTVTGLTLTSKLYNLYTNSQIDKSISFTHHRDVTSISNYSSVFTSSSTNRIYELSSNNVTDLASNFYNVHTSLDVYDNSNHEKEIQSHTIPFISGSFTVDADSYPDICGSFEWNGNIDGYNNSVYINRNYGIDLDGTSGGDYKWIVYDVDLDEASQYYNSSSSSYSSNVQGTGGEGINVTTIMNLLFDSTMISKFSFDGNNQLTNDNTYIFIVGYRNDTGKVGYYLGTMSKTFQASSSTTWYSNSNAGQTSLSSILDKTDDRAGVSQSSSVTAISNMIGDSYNSWGSSDRIIQSLGSSAFTEYKLYFGIKIT